MSMGMHKYERSSTKQKKQNSNPNAPKRQGLLETIVSKVSKLIHGSDFKERSRMNPKDFTRNRTMSFEELMMFMLIQLKCSTQTGLRRFFAMIGKHVFMKQQSFSEARKKVKVSAFIELFRLTSTEMLAKLHKTWHGYRVHGIDGTKIALPADVTLREYFGALGKDGSAPTAQGSILCDVLNDIVIDARIEPLSVDERTLAKEHIDQYKTMGIDSKSLFIFDRGYPSFELIEKLENDGFAYVMRVKSKFNNAIDAQSAADGYVWLEQNGKRLHIRVIKFMLDSGEIETLITNIKDKRLGVKAFKKLYFMRWPVEIKYDVLKNKLQVENFSSRTVDGIRQDFYAAMFLTNIAAASAQDAQALIEQDREDKCNKYQYQANINELIGVLKDRLVQALTKNYPRLQALLIDIIIQEIRSNVVPKRLDRVVPRNPSPRKAKFHHNRKANC